MKIWNLIFIQPFSLKSGTIFYQLAYLPGVNKPRVLTFVWLRDAKALSDYFITVKVGS